LGTFIAIALSMPDFTVQDSKSLDREISLLLSGIGTAFYASIYGIMLSLIWTYFEKRGMAKVEKQIHELEKLYSGRVWKKSELIKHEHMQNALKDQEIIKTLKETFNLNFIKELNEQYVQSFTMIIEETNNSFTQIAQQMQKVSTELSDTLKSIYAKQESVDAVAVMLDNISSFNANAYNLQQSLDRFDSSVNHTFEKIDEELGNSVEKLAMFARLISEQNQLILKNMVMLKNKESELK
jgi:hypothetical protein